MYQGGHSQFVKKTAARLGFDYCGIARATALPEDAARLETWLNKGLHAGMQYMENHFDLRTDPTKLVPGARSVITLLKNYYPAQQQATDAPRIAKYAWGQDYHDVIRSALKTFLFELKQQFGDIDGRGFVDSAPVLERTWAQRSGIGWIGKNGNLLTKKNGSFFFIATLVTDLELEYDDPYAKDYCGSCNKCVEACPTEAILPDKTINGGKCISYFTIELKEQLIPDTYRGKFDNWAFGCDTCQDVCPWNRFSKPHHEPAFEALPGILDMNVSDWEGLSETRFNELFRHSPLKRSKYSGMQRNLSFLKLVPDGKADHP